MGAMLDVGSLRLIDRWRGWRASAKRLLRLAFVLCCVGLAAAFGIDRYMQAYSESYILPVAELPQADAILVLGAYVYPDGRVSAVVRDRLDTALDAYAARKSTRILVSGDHGRKEYDEVNTMKAYLLSRGLTDERVFMDHAGFNTYDSMYRARDIFKARKLIIVTQQYHLSRAVYLARRMGIDAYGVAADRSAYPNIRKYELREFLARNKDFAAVHWLKPGPVYLGEAIPLESADGTWTNDR